MWVLKSIILCRYLKQQMLFDRTVRTQLARTFGATLVVILTIVLTSLLIRTVGQAAAGSVAPQDVVLLLGYVMLSQLPLMLSVSLFVAIVVALGRMYRDSEMAIWFASGVGLSRFVRPVLRMAWPVLLVIALLQLVVWPWGNRNSLELRERYQQRSDLSRVTPGVFQSSSDGRRVFFVERDNADPQNARNVFVMANTDRSESVTSAKSGRLVPEGEDRFLVLERGQRNEVDAKTGERTQSSFESYRVLVDEKSARSAESRPPKAESTVALMRNPSLRSQGEITWRVGMVLAACNLLLLGIGLAAANPRRASNWNLLFALLAFVVYFNLSNLSQSWVATGRVGMGVALFGLHGGVFLAALGLLWWRDHAAVLRFGRRGTPPAGAAGAAA
jgi:lipopolysaccharide export system permease protein